MTTVFQMLLPDSSDQLKQNDSSKRLRILMLADPFIPVPPKLYGGIERIIDMLCRGYQELGHDVALVAHADSTVDCKLFRLPSGPASSMLNSIRSALTIRRAVGQFRPDVIHSFARLAYLWSLLRSPIPKVMSYQREPTLQRIKRSAYFARQRSLMFTGCSDYITKQIRSVANATTVYNGVPLDRYELRETVDEDAPLVFLGRVEQIKGTHNAIKIARLTKRRLIIAGNIPDDPTSRTYFETRIRPELDDRIAYIGPVDDRQKNELLRSALAMIMAIEWEEPFGIVIVESLACGTPVLGTPRGAIPEILEDGRTGYIRSDVNELANCVEKLSSISRRECRQVCELRFSGPAIVSEYLRVYHSMLP